MVKDYNLVENKIEITETKQVILDGDDLERELLSIAREKPRLLEANKDIIARYNALLIEEEQLLLMKKQITPVVMEVIADDVVKKNV